MGNEEVLLGFDDDEPMVTFVIALRLGGRVRFILARQGLQQRPLTLVANDAGGLPAFATFDQAADHAARAFPVAMPGMERLEAAERDELEKLMRPREPIAVDFDAARAWADDPASGAAGPVALAMAWEVLTAGDAAPPMAPFDPMSMPDLDDRARHEGEDGEWALTVLTGMTLSGFVSEARRRHADDDGTWPAGVSDVWTPRHDGVLANILREGIAKLSSRLS